MNGSFYHWPQRFLFSGDHKVSVAFMFSSLLGLTSRWKVQSCPEWDFNCSLIADRNVGKLPDQNTEASAFWKHVS